MKTNSTLGKKIGIVPMLVNMDTYMLGAMSVHVRKNKYKGGFWDNFRKLYKTRESLLKKITR